MPSRATQVQRRVLLLLLERNYGGALKLLSTLLLRHPSHNVLRLNRATCYLECSMWQVSPLCSLLRFGLIVRLGMSASFMKTFVCQLINTGMS